MLPTINYTNRIVRTNNDILDYLINTKLGSLKDTDILISGIISDLSDIAPADLSCLIGNILDNAIESVQHSEIKRIELSFNIQNDNRIILCKNTMSSSVLETNKELKTTKSDTTTHGLGHKIVGQIIEKYHGIIDYFEQDGMFGVELIIPVPKHS